MVKDTRIIRIFYENVANPQPSPKDRYREIYGCCSETKCQWA
jgi:hypothetical protein